MTIFCCLIQGYTTADMWCDYESNYSSNMVATVLQKDSTANEVRCMIVNVNSLIQQCQQKYFQNLKHYMLLLQDEPHSLTSNLCDCVVSHGDLDIHIYTSHTVHLCHNPEQHTSNV